MITEETDGKTDRGMMMAYASTHTKFYGVYIVSAYCCRSLVSVSCYEEDCV